jgi:hypothetical protein
MGVGDQSHAPAALPPGKSPGTHCTAGWVRSTAGQNGCGDEKISGLPPNFEPRPLELAASRCTVYALPVPRQVLVQVPNNDFHWNFFGQQDEISQVEYLPSYTSIFRTTQTK